MEFVRNDRFCYTISQTELTVRFTRQAKFDLGKHQITQPDSFAYR